MNIETAISFIFLKNYSTNIIKLSQLLKCCSHQSANNMLKNHVVKLRMTPENWMLVQKTGNWPLGHSI